MSVSSSLIRGVLVPIAVYAVFALARKFLPAASPSDPDSAEQDLSVSPESQWLVNIAIVIVGVVFAFATHSGLVRLNHYLSFSQSAEGYRLWPQPAIWWFFPGFGALALAWDTTLFLWRASGRGERAESYERWSNAKAGFNSTKMLRWMALLIVLPIGVLTALAIPMHSTLRQHDIIDCGYAFARCELFQYSAAQRLVQIDGFRDRNGKLQPRAGIIMLMKDGRRWSSAEWGDFEETVDPELAELLQSKTGLRLEHFATERDMD